MEIIDVHIHFSRIDSFIRTAESISRLDYSGKALSRHLRRQMWSRQSAWGLRNKERSFSR